MVFLLNIYRAQSTVGDETGMTQSIQKAYLSIDTVKDAETRCDMLVHVADILYSVGETLDAINAYKMASDAAISVSDPMERIFALDDVATARFEAGDVAGALSTLSQLYEVARIFPDSEW